MSGDLIELYLAELRATLRTPGGVLVLAEAEDHLAEAVAAGLAVGMSEREAQQAAISAFGSIRAVTRAHRVRFGKAVLAENVVMATLKLACIFLYVVAATGVLALIEDLAISRAFVGADPAGSRYSASSCLHWMQDNLGAHTCAQASMLESSGDIVVLGAVGAILGTLLLAGYLIACYLQRMRGREMPDVLPRFAFPAVAVTGFGGLAAWLAADAALRAAGEGGPGSLLSGAVACAVVAAWYAPRLRHGLASEELVTRRGTGRGNLHETGPQPWRPSGSS
jgi:hypothetical protein